MQRSLGFAALGVTTLVPLLIVIAAAASLRGDGGFPNWIILGIGLSGRSATAVRQLFTSSGRVISSTTAVGVVGLAFFGLSFSECVKRAFELIWELPRTGLRSVWRQVVWLGVLVGFLLAIASLSAGGPDSWTAGFGEDALMGLSSVLFFWWTASFLLEGRIGRRALLPGAVLTVAGLVVLRACSSLFFDPAISASAISYGAFGTVLIIVSWLSGVGYVVFGSALVGRHFGVRSSRGFRGPAWRSLGRPFHHPLHSPHRSPAPDRLRPAPQGTREKLPEGEPVCESVPASSPSPWAPS